MQVLILAAGDGGRLLPLTASRPKALVRVAGTPLIDRIVDALVEGGASEFVVVLGYRGEQVRDHLARRRDAAFRFAWNDDPAAGNARSLLCGVRELAPAPFLLCMGDHLLSRQIVGRALAAGDGNLVLIDRRRAADADGEGSRVRVAADGTVIAIGKGLAEWDAIDTGLFRLRPDALGHLAGLPATAELNDAWQGRVAERRLRAVDVEGAWWADIDTEADLVRAEEALLRVQNHGVRRAGLARP